MSNNKEHSEQSDIPIEEQDASNGPITSTSGNRRPAYTYDSTKVTLRFIFANRDGLAVTMECTPNQTIGEVKGALLSVWPEGAHQCSDVGTIYTGSQLGASVSSAPAASWLETNS